MSDIFSQSAADLAADPHLGADALLFAGGAGPGSAFRLVLSKPELPQLGVGGAVVGAWEAMIPAALGFRPKRGDRIECGADAYKVEVAEQDTTGASWRVTLSRLP